MSIDDEVEVHDRAADVCEDLRRDSLVGSSFLGNDTNQWQGIVVAEPQPGIYLVELFEWFVGTSTHQILIKIEDMMDWKFFDTGKWRNNYYSDGEGRRWASLRKEDSD